MNKVIISILLVAMFLLSSCSSTYFYSTINSSTYEVEKVDNGDFLFQNDSLWVAHSFRGENAPLQITVFNKLNTPLYIDWSKSSLIMNGVAHPYTDASALFVGDRDGQEVVRMQSTSAPHYVSFIPPHSMVSHRTLSLRADFTSMKDKEFEKATLEYDSGTTGNVKIASYLPDNTPMSFSSYLTIYSDDRKPQPYKIDFYLSNVLKTKTSPPNMPNNMADRGDTFYNIKHPNNTAWHIIGISAIVASSIAIDIITDSNNCYNCD